MQGDFAHVLGRHAKDIKEKIRRVAAFGFDAVFLEMRVQRFCGQGQMVMRDFGEEQMVDEMPVGNVMHAGIEPRTIAPVDGLQRAFDERPCAIVVHQRVAHRVVVMLEVGDGRQPPRKHDP